MQRMGHLVTAGLPSAIPYMREQAFKLLKSL